VKLAIFCIGLGLFMLWQSHRASRTVPVAAGGLGPDVGPMRARESFTPRLGWYYELQDCELN
jgi:hypothetical protein